MTDQTQTQPEGDNRPLRIPLVTDLSNRGETPGIDARLVNCYAERISQQEAWIYKRPGMHLYGSPGGAPSTGQGIYNWNGDIYSVFGGNFYKNNTLIGFVGGSGTFTFNSTLGATPSLFFQEGTVYYQYNSSTGLTQLFPATVSSSCPGQAYLDGTMYLLDHGANIWGSGLNDLTTWAADNLIKAQIEPDLPIMMAKQLVYVIAFKIYSTEMFFDEGNATGSPLGSVPGQKLNYGMRHAGTLAEISGMLLWVDAIRSGGFSVRIMDQLTAQPCSTPQVERLLQRAEQQAYFQGPVYSWSAKIDGHMFYCLTIQGLNVTLVYDLTQKIWYEWVDTNGNYMPIVASTFLGGATLLQGQADGNIYQLDSTVGTDNGKIITSDIYTPEFDAGTYKRKTIGKLRFIGDTYPGNTIQVRVSDDDFKTWSNYRSVDMGQVTPTLDNCGTFRRRVWHLHFSTTASGRLIKALEPEIELGDL